MPIESESWGKLPLEVVLLEVGLQFVPKLGGEHGFRVQVPHRTQPQAQRGRIEGEFLQPLGGVADQ